MKNQNLVISDFSKYYQIDLISALAGLQIYSKNHSYIPRLTTACQIACSIKKSGSVPVRKEDLHQLFNKYFPAKGELSRWEDPPEDLFTENIDFVNGNNIVYSGISPDGSHILRILLHSIFENQDSLTDEFIHEIFPHVLALLLLSNEVAIRAGHTRYSGSEIQLWGDIKMPENEEFTRLQQAVVFSPEDIHRLFSPYEFDETILNPFITRIGSSDFLKGRIHENPLYRRPFVKIDDHIILVVPSSIVGALRHFILTIGKKHKKIKQLGTAISKTYWVAAKTSFELLGFKPTDIELPPLENDVDFIEGIYSIDSDKVAYIQMITDRAEVYKEVYPLRALSDKKQKNERNHRYENVISWLFELKNPQCQHIFFIAVVGCMGRSISIDYSPEPEHVRACILTSENLEVLSRIDSCDALKLWKFVGYFNEVSSYHQICSFSILDMFEFYLRSHVPRDIWKEPGPATIIISAGSGQRLRMEAAENSDVHAVKSGNPPAWISVLRQSLDSAESIYVPEGTLLRPFEFVVEGYNQPIWIHAWPRSGKIFECDYPFYFQFAEVCSFWIWKMTSTLKSHLIPLGIEPIHILVGYEKFNKDGYIDWETNETGLRCPSVSVNIKMRMIFLTINGTMFDAIDEDTNKGERCLVDTVLSGFGNLLEGHSLPNTLEPDVRRYIVDQYLPFGTIRKLYHKESNKEPLFDPRWLPKVRFLQDHDLKEQFNGYTNELENFKEYSGITSLDENNVKEIYNYCAAFHFKRLKDSISDYSWISLLSFIISQYEALIRFLATRQHETTSSINLYDDFETRIKQVLSDRELVDDTSIAMRNLIEIISAEPPKGTKQVSTTDFDTLLAGSCMFIHNGFLSDAAYCGLFCNLPNKGKGNFESVERKAQDYVEQFYEGKYREDIEAAYEDTLLIPEPKSSERIITEKDFDPVVQKAFQAEFGLEKSRLIQFFAFIIDLGFGMETSAPHLPLSEFKARAKSALQWEDEDIDRAITQFSLTPREKYEDPPIGFRKEDIFPWLYNRRISYLVRPLIIGPEPVDDPLIFWGPRNSYLAMKHLFNTVYSGRYHRADNKTAAAMKALISRIQNKSSKDFEREVALWFKENTPWIVDSLVMIAPEGRLSADTNLGDIDVLAIDTSGKKIYSIECKMINFGRNPREVLTEIQKFLGESEDNKKSMKRHLNRDAWLKSNIEVVCSTYKLPRGDYSVKSFFIVSEELATAYIRETPLPIIAFSRIKRDNFKTLIDTIV
jgi:hypothetical protein